MESAEHTLEHWDLFQTYLKLYEDTLNEWLEREGVENAQFYKDVQHVQDTTTDPKVQEFVYCLLAVLRLRLLLQRHGVGSHEARRVLEAHPAGTPRHGRGEERGRR